jgi:hypothetical protein
MEILQDLDKSIFKARNLEAIFDMSNETNRTNLDADILEQTTNEGYDTR